MITHIIMITNSQLLCWCCLPYYYMCKKGKGKRICNEIWFNTICVCVCVWCVITDPTEYSSSFCLIKFHKMLLNVTQQTNKLSWTKMAATSFTVKIEPKCPRWYQILAVNSAVNHQVSSDWKLIKTKVKIKWTAEQTSANQNNPNWQKHFWNIYLIWTLSF